MSTNSFNFSNCRFTFAIHKTFSIRLLLKNANIYRNAYAIRIKTIIFSIYTKHHFLER